jgi:hypothetical protein
LAEYWHIASLSKGEEAATEEPPFVDDSRYVSFGGTGVQEYEERETFQDLAMDLTQVRYEDKQETDQRPRFATQGRNSSNLRTNLAKSL